MIKKKETITLAMLIALLPPLWAILAPYLGIKVGAVALICASLYVLSGNQLKEAVPLSIGLILGDIWSVIALNIIAISPWDSNITTFLTLAILGGIAVIISSFFPQKVSCASWLCGWAIGLTVLSFISSSNYIQYAFQIALAMLSGIWYVGVILDIIHKRINTFSKK
ncbi:DUF1097 family protein [Streptococcus gallolyticus]|uniref:DUF1097 family protein n=1 Tax=Streptococcus gallolyticus TaxID=315405 RepID=UPI0008884D4F|nr:DUF1097 family protein [Streptococcus gallolyticus]MCY7172317.1 DUF1097 family protein [Streptococcus gallolyticus subsp. gallolyticus]SDJ65490.1 Protein of unknown function [Streptococcus gallolyticus]SDL14778.1 Protein of unknown function [Streptococcus gallolyticus]